MAVPSLARLEDEHRVGLAVAAQAGQVGEGAVRAEDVVAVVAADLQATGGDDQALAGEALGHGGAARGGVGATAARAGSPGAAGPSPRRRTPGTRRSSGGCGSRASAAVRSRAHRATRVRAPGSGSAVSTAAGRPPPPGPSPDLNKADSKATLAACQAPSLRPGRSGRNPSGRVRCVSAPPRRCGRRPRRCGRSASPVAARGSTGPTPAPWWTSRCGSVSCCCRPAPRPRTSSRRSCG